MEIGCFSLPNCMQLFFVKAPALVRGKGGPPVGVGFVRPPVCNFYGIVNQSPGPWREKYSGIMYSKCH